MAVSRSNQSVVVCTVQQQHDGDGLRSAVTTALPHLASELLTTVNNIILHVVVKTALFTTYYVMLYAPHET